MLRNEASRLKATVGSQTTRIFACGFRMTPDGRAKRPTEPFADDDGIWMRTYWVYIMTNQSGTLYTGVTGDLSRRVQEHRQRLVPGFTKQYKIDRLVYAGSFPEVRDAIAREKQIKGWVRARKLALISESNPNWRDLGVEWFGPVDSG